MRWLLASTGAVLVTAALIFGPLTLWRHGRVTRDQVVQAVDKSLPDDHVEAFIQGRLHDLDGQLRDYHLAVGKVADRAAKAEARLEEVQRQLQDERQLLTRIKELLDHGGTQCAVGGRTYSRAEMTAEGKLRLTRCQQLQAQREQQTKLVLQLKKALEEGQANLTQAQHLKQETLGELQALKARLANARVRQELGDVMTALRSLPTSPDTDLARSLAEYRDRVQAAESNADYAANEAKGGGIVQWDDTVQTEDVNRAIAQFLKAPAKTASR